MIAPGALDVPVAGELVEVVPRVQRLTAPNPSLMTGPGTNTYLIGERELVVVDPGPDDEAHLDAVAAAAESYGRVRAIVVTHHHSDHAPGAAGLKQRTGAPVLGYESRETYAPDRRLVDGDVVELGDLAVRAVHTPGHASDHLCYGVDEPMRLLFSGDHVMGGSTVVIAPPDGDMADYLSSLRRLLDLEPAIEAIVPGHGPVLADATSVLAHYVDHRLEREEAVLRALRSRLNATTAQLVADVYTDVPEVLHPVARYSVWAHLLKLRAEGACDSDEPERLEADWEATSR